MKKSYFLGIDVAKASCDFALLKANGSCLWSGQFDNNPSSINRWLALLEARQLDLSKILFGFEATGVYSQTLLLVLQQFDLAGCQLNPAQIKYFGVSLNRRTKNDRADARLIARFLLERQPVATRALSPTEHQLKVLIHEREALAIDLTRKERLRKLKAWIKELDAAIKELIDSDPVLCVQAKLLCSIPGIALCSAAKILSQLAGKDFQSAHQLALYAGLNPKENKSGRFKGKTTLSKIGNAFPGEGHFQ